MQTAYDFYKRIWAPAALVVSNIERSGIKFNQEAATPALEQTRRDRLALETQLAFWLGKGTNWCSPKQVAELFHDRLGLPVSPIEGTINGPKRAKAGSRPTGAAAIQWIRANTVDSDIKEGLTALLAWKKVKKAEGFWEALPTYVREDGRIHCQLSMAGDDDGGGTETGRLTSKNPNLQQIPRDKTFRNAFCAEEGNCLVVLDYTGLEWRVLCHCLAHKYGDYSLVSEIKAGLDPHDETAKKLGIDRVAAKAINFGLNYGKSALGLSLQLGIPQKQAQAYLDAFFTARPGIRRFHRDIVEFARRNGFVRSLLGRYRYLDFEANTRRAERQALNVIQPAATDVVVCAMLKIGNDPLLQDLGASLVLQVHDEVLVECSVAVAEQVKARATELMETALLGYRDDFKCPLAVSGGIGITWGEAK